MTQNRKTHRNILIRSLAAIVLFGVYAFGMLGTSALVLGASSTAAFARGGGGGGHGGGGGGHGFGGGGHGFGGHGFGGGGHGFGGFHGRGFRGGGFGFGFYPGFYDDYYPYYEDQTACYVVRQRVMTRRGWRVRRVEVCE
jgi:hypothetical protein